MHYWGAEWKCVKWIYLTQNSVQWLDAVNTVLTFGFSKRRVHSWIAGWLLATQRRLVLGVVCKLLIISFCNSKVVIAISKLLDSVGLNTIVGRQRFRLESRGLRNKVYYTSVALFQAVLLVRIRRFETDVSRNTNQFYLTLQVTNNNRMPKIVLNYRPETTWKISWRDFLVKFFLEQATKAQSESRCAVLLFL